MLAHVGPSGEVLALGAEKQDTQGGFAGQAVELPPHSSQDIAVQDIEWRMVQDDPSQSVLEGCVYAHRLSSE